VLVKEVKPTYTADALRDKIQGSVWLEAVVLDDGQVGDVRVVRSLDPGGLDEQAIQAVSRWQFRPGRRDGVPVAVFVSIILDFSIR
jgi:protein TonB